MVKLTLGPVVTCALIGLLVAWLARPYYHETEQRFTKALAAKTVRVYRRLNSKYRRQVKRQESKINRALDKVSSNIGRKVEIQVRRLTTTITSRERATHGGGLSYASSFQPCAVILKDEACLLAHCPLFV